jgi:hypothetical protein
MDVTMKKGVNLSEKYSFYFSRTLMHIQRVQKNMFYLINKHSEELGLTLEDCKTIAQNALKHDASKFSVAQFEPYADFSIKMKKTNDYQKSTTLEFEEAWKDHYTVENHHFQSGKYLDPVELIEVCSDIHAMSEEMGGDTVEYLQNKWCKSHNDYFNGNKEHSNNQSYDDNHYWCMVCFMKKCIGFLQEKF